MVGLLHDGRLRRGVGALHGAAGRVVRQLATRLRVVRLDGTGRPPDLLRSLLRVVLICLVVPPLIYKPDGRGLHDLAVGTATVPLLASGPPG